MPPWRTSVSTAAKVRSLQELNRDGLTILVVTHEPDIACYAGRKLVVKDGRVRTDERAEPRSAADDLLAWHDEEGASGT